MVENRFHYIETSWGAIAESVVNGRQCRAMFSHHATCHYGVPDTQYGSPTAQRGTVASRRVPLRAMDEQGYTWWSRLQRRRTVTVAGEGAPHPNCPPPAQRAGASTARCVAHAVTPWSGATDLAVDAPGTLTGGRQPDPLAAPHFAGHCNCSPPLQSARPSVALFIHGSTAGSAPRCQQIVRGFGILESRIGIRQRHHCNMLNTAAFQDAENANNCGWHGGACPRWSHG